MNKKLMAVAVSALVLLSAAVLFGSRDPAPEPAPRAAAAKAPAPAARPAAGLPQPRNDNAPSPWAAHAPVATLPGAATPRDSAALPSPQLAQRDLKELEKIKMELSDAMRDGKQADPKKVVEALVKLKQMNGSAVSGVNLDAVINNVEKAQEMQALALEMQRESNKPGGPDRKALLAYVEQLKKLQAQVRTDFSVPQKPVSAMAAK